MIEILLDSLKTIWGSFIGFLPTLLAALIVFIIGWLIAVFLGKVANRIIKTIKLDVLLAKLGFRTALAKAKLNLDSPKFFEELVKWFFIIVFLMAAVDILGLDQVSLFLKGILFYLPNVIVAAIVLLAAVIVANFMQKLVKASANTAGLKSASAIGTIVKWAILIFGFVIALTQLGIAPTLIQTIIIGLIAMLALAGGLAFGLGGRDAAARLIEKIRQDLGEK
ncbi:MAG: mechanosensitive ion channel family protein [Patescibacteria group bacterium]